MEKPLLVYLDSSDWSNLAAAASPEPFPAREKWLDIRCRLRAAREAGRAEFRFSQVIVIEAYPTSVAHHAQGVARARTIAELCGPLALLETNTLTRAEARKLALGVRPPFDRAIALRDDGAWHSDPDDMLGKLGSGVLADARSMVRDLLKEDLPQFGKRKRRALEGQIVGRRGRFADWARESLLDPLVMQEMGATATVKLGLPPDTPGIDTLARVMAGTVRDFVCSRS